MMIKTKLKKKIFYSEKNQYFIGSFNITSKNNSFLENIEELKYEKSFTANGYVGLLKEGSIYQLQGKIIESDKYGKQFQITQAIEILPTSSNKIVDYIIKELKIPLTRLNINKMKAKLGNDFLNKISEDISLLEKFEFITDDIKNKFKEKLTIEKSKNLLISKFLDSSLSVRDLSFIKNDLEVSYDDIDNYLKENPYYFIKCMGITINKIDKLLNIYNYKKESNERFIALAYELLNELSFKYGDTYFQLDMFLNKFKNFIKLDKNEFIKELEIGKLKGLLRIFEDYKYICINNTYEDETFILEKLTSLNNNKVKKKIKVSSKKYDEIQIQAIEHSVNKSLTIISGAPGTGKTTVIDEILKYVDYKSYNDDIAVLTPTGRAAQRINQSLSNLKNTIMAKTIHSFLKWKENGKFYHNENNTLDTRILIIDEMSMVGSYNFARLLKALPKLEKIVLVGDIHQLPSIDPGYLLHDLKSIYSDCYIELKNNYRQKDGKEITELALKINNMNNNFEFKNTNQIIFIDTSKEDRDISIKNILKETNALKGYVEHKNKVQFIGTTKKGKLGTNIINELVQKQVFDIERKYLYNDERYKYHSNDKVINQVNNYDVGITNGEIGFLKDYTISKKDIQLTLEQVNRELNFIEVKNNFTLGYSITTHKSQGSEFDTVVFMLDRVGMMLLNNNLVYTAVTRAKKKLYILGDLKLFKDSIVKKERKRNTILSLNS